MPIGSDFEIQNDKDIRYTGSTANYTVLELHRWLQDLADDASSGGDDFMDITRDTPSDKSFDTIINLINGYNIDDTAAQHLYGGSIIQDSGNTIYDGIQVLAPAGMRLEIMQNGALISPNFWTTGLNADSTNGISHRFMLKVRTAGADIDGRRLIALTREFGFSYLEFPINGTARGVNVMAFTGWTTDLNNQTAVGTIAGYTTITNLNEGYIGIDVNNNGVDEYYYSKWDRATYTINQFYERMKWLTRRGTASTVYGLDANLFRGITHEITIDTPTGTFDPFEKVTWTGGSGQMLAINSPTAGTKMWIQLLTGVIPADNQVITGFTSTATCQVNVTVTERTISTPFCGVSTGTSIIGAYGFGFEATDLSASDKVFDLTNTQYQAPNYVTFSVNGLVSTEDTVLVGPLGYRFEYDTEASGPFVVGETLTFASPAGTAVLSYFRDLGTVGEMYIGPMLSGTLPTDNSTILGGTSAATAAVNGAVNNAVNLRQFTLNGALSGAAVTSVVVNESIPGDTPATGTIRIQRANNAYSKHPYSAYNAGTKTFTITSHDFSSNNAANGANSYLSYIDKIAASSTESFTSVYSGDRSLYIRVRDGGVTPIKTFETTGTLGSSGGSATAVRTSDL